jgi:hypothetical protein
MKPVAHDDTQFTGPKRTLTLEPLEQRLLLQADWTFMVYLNGDNNTEASAVNDFLKMAHVGSTADVNIVVQFDRSPLDQTSGVGYTDANGDWSDTRRGLVAHNDVPSTSWGTSIGATDMGDPAVLQDFITYAITNFAADHYALVVWGPGDGYNGTSFDQTSADSLTMSDLSTGIGAALTATSVTKIDVLDFDQSVMGLMEVADQVKGVANYMVTAEDQVPTDGLPYDQVLGTLTGTPLMKPVELATLMAADYATYYTFDQTFTVTNLAEVGPLAASLNSFATTFISQATATDRFQLALHHLTVPEFNTPDALDLGVLMTDISGDPLISQPLRDAADAVLSVYSDTIVTNFAGPFGGTGLTIYMPQNTGTVDPNYNASNLLFAAETHWDEFLGAWTTPPPASSWTFMVYMGADTNLEGDAINDFLEMASVGSSEAVNIVVQLDRSAGFDTSFGNWTDTRRGLISQGDVPSTSWGTSIGEADMGDPNTLADFINWAETNYPAQHYALTLWDHGDGLNGAIFDDNSGLGQPDNLTVPEMGQALQAAATPVDILNFDACDMNMLEVAYQVRNSVSYMVGPEDLGWSVGSSGFLAPFDQILTNLTADSSMSPRNLAVMMADLYFHSWSAGNLTIMASVIDLSKVQMLAQDMDNLAQEIVANGSISDRILLDKHRTESPVYPNPTFAGPPNDSRDLGTWLQKVSEDTGITPGISADAAAALGDYNDAVIANFVNPGAGTGLAIYMPEGAPAGSYSWQNLEFAGDTHWGDFLTWRVADQITPVAFFQSGSAKVSFFDTSGILDINPANILVKFSGSSVKSIILIGTDPMMGLGIVISGATSVGAITDMRTAPGEIAFIASNTGAKSVAINSAIAGAHLNGSALGGLIFPSDIVGNGNPLDTTSLYFKGGINKLALNGSLFSGVYINGPVGTATLNNCDLLDDVVIRGNVGRMTFTGLGSGLITSHLSIAGSLNQLDMAGGALTPGAYLDIAGTLGKANIGEIEAGLVDILNAPNLFDGIDPRTFDFSQASFFFERGATLQARGGISQLSVGWFTPGSIFYNTVDDPNAPSPPSPASIGVNQRYFITFLMSNVLAPNIGSLNVAGSIDHARILAGADLGADLLPGGTNANADTYNVGRIGSVSVGTLKLKANQFVLPITPGGTDQIDYGFGDIQDSIVGAGLFRSEDFASDEWGGSGYNLVTLHDERLFEDGSSIGKVTVAHQIISTYSETLAVGNDFATATPPAIPEFPFFVPFGVGSYKIGSLNVNKVAESPATIQASFGVWYRDPYVFVETPRGLGFNA